MIFRINLAMLRGRIWDSQAGEFWPRAQSIDFAIFEVSTWAGVIQLAECQLLPTPFVFCHLDHVLSPMLSAKMRLAGEKSCSRWRYYVEVVHRRRTRRLQPTAAHAAKRAWFSLRRYPDSQSSAIFPGGFRPHVIDQEAHALVVGRIQP